MSQGRKDKVIAQHIKQCAGLSRLRAAADNECASLFPVDTTPVHKMGTLGDVTFDVVYTGDIADGEEVFIPLSAVKVTHGALPVGDNAVTIVSCCCRSYDNNGDDRLSAAFSVMRNHKAFAGVDDDKYDLQENTGLQRNAFVDFDPHTKKEEDRWALHIQTHVFAHNKLQVQYHYANPAFCLSTYRIGDDDDNLMHGIIKIPEDVCKQANLPLYSDEGAMVLHMTHREIVFAADQEISDEERRTSKWLNWPEDKRMRHWYAMDPRHVLSWGLHMSWDSRRAIGLEAERLDIVHAKEKRIAGPFLVPDTTLRTLIHDFKKTWGNRVDARRDICNTEGFFLSPKWKHQGAIRGVKLKFTIHCKYIVWRDDVPPSKWAPALHPSYPGVERWVDVDLSGLKI